jgi:queuine tRNA-ribosyltransferase
MQFKLIAKDSASKARAGEIQTDHGAIETPIFMPVGTAGTVKAVNQQQLVEDIEAQIILGNTYHLSSDSNTAFIQSLNGYFISFPYYANHIIFGNATIIQ